MQTIHLLIEDDYIEEFIHGLPKDKVIVIEEDFKENKIMLDDELKNYQQNPSDFIPYSKSMKELSIWLNEREK